MRYPAPIPRRLPAARRPSLHPQPRLGPPRRGALALLAAALLAAGPARSQIVLEATPVAGGLFRPLALADPGDGSGRLFLVQQSGEILIWDGAEILPTPFLDLSALVSCCGERGLLGMAFHPDYPADDRFFVGYTAADPEGDTVIASYRVSDDDPDLADPDSAVILLEVEQPAPNHNNGQLLFGADGYLYLGMGDGGPGQDPDNQGQSLDTLLGKILRLDVDAADPGLEYAIPPSNPFVGVAGARDEIWARGLRNPWRFTFDRASGDLWIGDVGQNAFEEIDLQLAASPGGENYGWRRMEGSSCFLPATECNDGTLVLPVLEYDHGQGCSVTGGYRYRGALHPRLRGVYLYADFCQGTVWGTVPRCDGQWTSQTVLASGSNIGSFGEDAAGELYLIHLANTNGTLLRLGLAPGSGGPSLAPDPAALDFGNVLAGDSAALELLLVNDNPGPEAVLVEGIAASDPSRFSVEVGGGADPCGTSTPCLAPGESCTVEVSFSSAETGFHAAELGLSGNFDPVTVALGATAYEPCPYADFVTYEGPDPVAGGLTVGACRRLTAGPGVAVTETGELVLRAGLQIKLRDGVTVAGTLRMVHDPLLAID